MKIVLDKICKSFGKINVFEDYDATFDEGKMYLLKGDSGSGKTTLLNIIMGLVEPDSGEVKGADGLSFSVVFQEDRLIEELSSIGNVAIVCPGVPEEKIRKELIKLLPEEALDKPAGELSGGMRRRLSIVRACLHDSDVLIADEPLAGLDITNRKNVVEYLKENINGRIFIIASHSDLWEEFCEVISID